MSFVAHLSQQVTYSSLPIWTCGRFASTAKTTPLTGHCVSLPVRTPSWADTFLASYLSLVAHAKRHTPDIAGSKRPVSLPPVTADEAASPLASHAWPLLA